MIAYVVYAYDQYYPEPADRQVKGIFLSKESADQQRQEIELRDRYDRVEIDVFTVKD